MSGHNKNRLIKSKSTAPSKIIISGFLGIILIGALLLMLPVSSKDRVTTPFIKTLFTSVSATCVTGLICVDTATHWSLFGQIVILLLIQTGGMGVLTVALSILRASGKKIGLRQRSVMQESISAPQVGGIIRLLGFILKGTAVTELAGAALLSPVFIPELGVWRGIWYAVFHSVSAFCNAGFDLCGICSPFSSLTRYADNAYLNVVIMLLIIIGGIGFLTWSDIVKHGVHIKRYSLQSKIILVTSAVLIFIPAVYFFFFEYGGEPLGARVLHSLFQSVTARTAGFNTTELSAMSEPGKAVMTVLMIIGGSPGSTAGGMKTTTVAILLMTAVSVFRRGDDVEVYKRRISEKTVKTAGAVLFMYLTLFTVSSCALSLIEGLPLVTCMFECGSAIGTAGLTLGITPGLSTASHVILMIMMFSGRVGGMTLIYAALPSQIDTKARLPLENVTVG